jgi:hypothetical protein
MFTIQIYHNLKWRFISEEGSFLNTPKLMRQFDAFTAIMVLKRIAKFSSFRMITRNSYDQWVVFALFEQKDLKEEICWKKYGF